jgi:hypothetical protein
MGTRRAKEKTDAMKADSTGDPEGRRPWERSRAGSGPPAGGPGGPIGPEDGDSRWRHPTLSIRSIVVVILLAVWTLFAVQWKEQDCPLVPTSYVLVLTHGTPSVFEGCGDHAIDVTDD